ncbi:MAG TPA: lipocalin-like domain-containing protein [Chloroflexota bacterium]|nr:lipocalin-like domain-containing protein [Chloroflexota bacterium]
MFAAVMRANRRPFAGDDLLEGTPEEWATAGRGYVTYCGRYDVSVEAVVHHVEMSLFPNWTEADQVRLMTLNGDHLTLTTGPTEAGG